MFVRLFDLVLSVCALLLTAPLLLAAALGIRLSSPGPALYRAQRIGRDGQPFIMFKMRTMHIRPTSPGGPITAKKDNRVFPLGVWLRRLKIDELPQLLNVLKGDMGLVGPRPEDPHIVENHYAPIHFETLHVAPGLASPGSIYNYTHGEEMLDTDDPQKVYLERLLPVKLALDTVYVRRASLLYNLRIIGRTTWTILAIGLNRGPFPDPPEMKKARDLIHPAIL